MSDALKTTIKLPASEMVDNQLSEKNYVYFFHHQKNNLKSKNKSNFYE